MGMSWLKNIGQKAAGVAANAGKVFAQVEGLAPIVQMFTPPGSKVSAVETAALDRIAQMEQLALQVETFAGINAATGGTTSNEVKIKMLATMVAQVVLAAEKAAGHECLNPELQTRAINGFAQATVDLANSRKAPE